MKQEGRSDHIATYHPEEHEMKWIIKTATCFCDAAVEEVLSKGHRSRLLIVEVLACENVAEKTPFRIYHEILWPLL
eukprot:3012074-Amphidinium_carterae.1